MDVSPFGTIPPEIRTEIYKRVLHTVYGVWLQDDCEGPLIASVSEPQNPQPLAITKVCRIMRQESLPIFFDQNDFILDLTESRQGHEVWYALCRSRETPPQLEETTALFTSWVNSIGPLNASSIKHLKVLFDVLPSPPYDIMMKKWMSLIHDMARQFLDAGLGSRCSLRAEINTQYLIGMYTGGLDGSACDAYDLDNRDYDHLTLDVCMRDAARTSSELTVEFKGKKDVLESHANHADCYVAKNLAYMLDDLRDAYNVLMNAVHQTNFEVWDL